MEAVTDVDDQAVFHLYLGVLVDVDAWLLDLGFLFWFLTLDLGGSGSSIGWYTMPTARPGANLDKKSDQKPVSYVATH